MTYAFKESLSKSAKMEAATVPAAAPPAKDISANFVSDDISADLVSDDISDADVFVTEAIDDESADVQLAVATADTSRVPANVPPNVFRFSELPFELQLEVWEYAIEFETNVLLNPSIFDRARHYYYRNGLRYPTPYAGFIRSASQIWNLKKDKLQYPVRLAMMGVCRLSRKYALEQWKKELEGIVLSLDGSTPNDRFWFNGAKKEILGMLDERVKGIVRRMKGEV